jgi:DNA processing protein
MSLTEAQAWAVLATAEGVGPRAFGSLVRRFGSARGVVEAARPPGARSLRHPPPDPAPDGPDPLREGRLVEAIVAAASDDGQRRLLASVAEAGVSIVTLEDADYPTRLREIADPPPVLFASGARGAIATRPAVAVVGTRRASEAGRRIAARLAGEIAATGTAIVSGLAVGIDGVAHDAALREGAPTMAVLGSGHLRLYPAIHRGLARRIERAGGAVVTELAPTTRGTSFGFPRRNRIVSGLADATLVVEAPSRSGALITARLALEQGRECFVVPGPLDAPGFAGSLALLREHHGLTRIVVGATELLTDLGLDLAPVARGPGFGSLGATATRLAVAISDGLSTLDDLVAELDLAPAAVLGAITRLEERGLVIAAYGRYRPHGALATRGRRALDELAAGARPPDGASVAAVVPAATVGGGSRAPPGGPGGPSDGPVHARAAAWRRLRLRSGRCYPVADPAARPGPQAIARTRGLRGRRPSRDGHRSVRPPATNRSRTDRDIS